MQKGALDGIRVLELGLYLNGPYIGRLLAELGAEVIKIEPPWGDPMRNSPPFINGDSLHSIYYNVNKKFITLNLKTDKGRELFLQLITKSDIVISNFRPETLEKLKIGYKDLVKINPRIILVSSTGYGYNSPYKDLPAFDPIVQALSGLMDSTGYPDRPTRAGMALLDFVTAAYAVIAVLAALIYRDKTGKGQFIDMSMYDVSLTLSMQSLTYLFLGHHPRVGPTSLVFSPEYLYKAKDGYVYVIIPTDEAWRNLAKKMGREDLINNPKYKTIADRIAYRDEINKIVQDYFKNLTKDEIVKLVIDCGGAAAPVRELKEQFEDPHVKDRNMFVEFLLNGNKIIVPGSPFKMSETPGVIKWPGLPKGYHNEEVYRELLGLSKDEIEKLKREDVI
ncbi:CoA transferase [Sulfolobus sp. S-194]|uniref:CaiB/BaiF CoA transferase family protein n=1 Tax=Sulfolobus sp. S-194 TaxID=2512240 RepID=UPI00143717B0|nr:CaiB/BaiF CoA-transferase family protein [Sulfolobus sp. S-194]QIW23814.1 CoA transferase [Sulfolobus sp. S-194]